MRLTALIALIVPMWLTSPLAAQTDTTLADIRAELTVLYADILRLKSELDPSGGTLRADAGSLLDRVNAIETSLQLMTARTEELEFRINRIVADGTNRVGDLEFRLCELEPNCDIGTLGETPSLGGAEGLSTSPIFTTPSDDGGDQLALSERQDFDAAQAAFDEGRYQAAADLFETFVKTYPGGPLGVQAQLGRGQSLENLGLPREAARAYLAGFSLSPEGALASSALFNLGRMLAAIGQNDEACVMLSEVSRRFPATTEAVEASNHAFSLSCP